MRSLGRRYEERKRELLEGFGGASGRELAAIMRWQAAGTAASAKARKGKGAFSPGKGQPLGKDGKSGKGSQKPPKLAAVAEALDKIAMADSSSGFDDNAKVLMRAADALSGKGKLSDDDAGTAMKALRRRADRATSAREADRFLKMVEQIKAFKDAS